MYRIQHSLSCILFFFSAHSETPPHYKYFYLSRHFLKIKISIPFFLFLFFNVTVSVVSTYTHDLAYMLRYIWMASWFVRSVSRQRQQPKQKTAILCVCPLCCWSGVPQSITPAKKKKVRADWACSMDYIGRGKVASRRMWSYCGHSSQRWRRRNQCRWLPDGMCI